MRASDMQEEFVYASDGAAAIGSTFFLVQQSKTAVFDCCFFVYCTGRCGIARQAPFLCKNAFGILAIKLRRIDDPFRMARLHIDMVRFS